MKHTAQIENEYTATSAKKQYELFTNCHSEKSPLNSQPHTHSYYELTMVMEGEITYWIPNNDPVVLHMGDIIFVPPNVIHHTYQSSDRMMRSAVVKFSPFFLYPMETTPSDVDCLLMTPIFRKEFFVFRSGTAVASKAKLLIHSVLEEKQQRLLGFELSIRGYLTTLYTTLLRNCESVLPMHGTLDEDALMSSGNARELYQIMVYLKENYQYNISMQEVAEVFGMSYYHFSRFFKKLTNKKFNEYLLELRLNYAKKKLLQDNKSISDIALECGFEYVSYFIQKFKANTGMTPREFQRKYCLAIVGQGTRGEDGEVAPAVEAPAGEPAQ